MTVALVLWAWLRFNYVENLLCVYCVVLEKSDGHSHPILLDGLQFGGGSTADGKNINISYEIGWEFMD